MSGYGRRERPDIKGMTSLKVDNIPPGILCEDLRRLFEKFGEIGDAHIPKDHERYGENRGFAYVRYFRTVVDVVSMNFTLNFIECGWLTHHNPSNALGGFKGPHRRYDRRIQSSETEINLTAYGVLLRPKVGGVRQPLLPARNLPLPDFMIPEMPKMLWRAWMVADTKIESFEFR
ncbi:uncharacterized protein [Macrobrachium rosenbergii]|uniref:uncharacterized protein n=1 Tax=Macrobrachium rosenbergii TaxID=79674 RepID=UPI0034D39C34